MKKKCLVFGTFDRLHDGHRFFLKKARKEGDWLIAVITTDETVQRLKKKKPSETLMKRTEKVIATGLVDQAIAGDDLQGEWSAVKKYLPDIIALGYDQTNLEYALKDFIEKNKLIISLTRVKPFKPETLHSSLLP